MYEIEQRIKYEIMLEFGLAGKIGRTLEKSSCSVISFAPDDITQIADAVQERTVNELGVFTSESRASFERMVIGYLNLMRANGAFEDKVFDEYDDDAKAFVELARDTGVPAPAEDNIGYEVEGDDGEVIATVEIAWPDKHVGFMTADQAEDKEKLENMGWKILNLLDATDMDTASLFGGDN